MLLELQNNDDAALARRGLKPPEEVRSVEVDGWVDTGAAQLVLPKAVTDALGVPTIGEARVKFADGRRDVRPVVANVWLRMGGRDGVFKAIVEDGREDAPVPSARVGAIVLEALDMVADPVSGTCHPRDAGAILAEM